ncbi:proton-conducting transporter membrane subunit [Mailhella massiliensis]|uniref:NADH dehydrogenase FAD-containing subunit n=1 Tax=Mailhella massiliensis TaxID=1903261 RepID=A0A921AUP8_9BACT|nr:proton-conducting transporter membrane subunit [Mailhella massiliensis]HJD96256.1 NADH dehydrogenase FAD-containing subunit [Mailhella massiliensis]
MTLALLLIIPLLAGLLMFLPGAWPRRGLLTATAFSHLALSCLTLRAVLNDEKPSALFGLLQPDALGVVFLMLASVLFTAASVYAVGYLREEEKKHVKRDIQKGQLFTNAPETRFLSCLCFFVAAMTLVTATANLGALWVGIEITTLASAPLIYFHRHQSSMEATWKYLMICSVGIALALLGNILMSVAFHNPAAPAAEGMDQLSAFMARAREVQGTGRALWLKAAFIFLLVGYGTKMGLAPMHTWLPDAHSQAPSMVSGMLSGALLNCALLGILRGHQIMRAAGLGDFSGGLLVFFGLFSMVTAAVFIVGQGHYKRLLAYSSVEHMGILALAFGVGGGALFGGMLHAVCHSLTKCMLFLVAGNILTRYHTLSSYDVRGLRQDMPLSGALWTAGFLAIVGSPPFGLFISEFTILKGIFAHGGLTVAFVYLAALAVIFVGMSIPVLRMAQGTPPRDVPMDYHESLFSVLPPAALCLMVLCLGLYVPDWLVETLNRAAALLGA